MIKGVIFDLDGTLINSAPDIADSVNELLILMGAETVLPDNEITSFLGEGADVTLKKSFQKAGIFSKYSTEKTFSMYREIYMKNMNSKTVLYDGVSITLEKLMKYNVLCAIVTNKPHEFIEKILKHFAITPYFDCFFGADSLPEKKPHPLPLITILERWELHADEVLMVGDHHIDIEVAKKAGIRSVFCNYGFGWQLNTSPDFEINEINGLENIITAPNHK